jgi:hypothetical protein
MSNEQRADYPNLILLCPSHHKITDDVTIYTVNKLRSIKEQHEAIMSQRCTAKKPLNTRTSLLADMIKHICSLDIEQVTNQTPSDAFNIEEKINYNGITRFKPFIKEYATYAGKLQKIYTEFEKAGCKSMVDTVLRTITICYTKQKGLFLGGDGSIENIQRNADNLIEAVQRDLHDLIESSPNNDRTIPYEEVEFALLIILVDAFMRCKILEEPK